MATEALLIDRRSVETLDLLGPTLQILTPPGEDGETAVPAARHHPAR